MAVIEGDIKKNYEFCHREVDYYDRIEKGDDMLRETFTRELNKLSK